MIFFLEMVENLSILSLAQVGGGQSLKILGGDPEMVRAAKMALDEHFRPGGSGPPGVVPPTNLNTSACSDAVCQTETGKCKKKRSLCAYIVHAVLCVYHNANLRL